MSKSLLLLHNMIMYRDSSMKQKVSPDLILFLCYLSGVHFSVTNNPFSLHNMSLNISKHEKKGIIFLIIFLIESDSDQKETLGLLNHRREMNILSKATEPS